MVLEQTAVEPFHKNGFVLGCEETREGVVIDPGDDVELQLAAVKRHGLSIRHILLTHAHLDHVTGVARAKQALGVPVWLHRDDNVLYESVVQQGLAFGIPVAPQPPIDRFYEGEGPLRFGRYAVRVLHTPGHCPGGVCLAVSRDTKEPNPRATLLVGDTLFAGSIGRTDLPGGSFEQLERSIHQRLFPLGDSLDCHTGHGPPTTIGWERQHNPFVGERARLT